MNVNIFVILSKYGARSGKICNNMLFWCKNEIDSNENGIATYQINKAVLLVTLGNRCG